jgi:four helix bundle protein
LTIKGVILENKPTIKTFMGLDVWKISHEFVINIYKLTRDFPKDETYGIISQLKRAASSIPANIAEGNGKQHLKEYIQFLYVSKSSLNETRYFLLLSKDLGYVEVNKYKELIDHLNHIEKMLMGLINSLKRKIDS